MLDSFLYALGFVFGLGLGIFISICIGLGVVTLFLIYANRKN